MANPEHVKKLKSGVEKWNAWREKYKDRRPDLSQASLRGANLSGANLIRAKLSDAILFRTNLSKTEMSFADLGGAELSLANLSGANLSDAFLFKAVLNGTNLSGASLDGSLFSDTMVARCDTLHLAINLDKVRHEGSSALDHHTLRACFKDLPIVFLKGIGYSDEEILAFQELYGKALEFYSCFISHTAEDDEFVNKLHQDLQNNNVSCWHYLHDAMPGRLLAAEINQAITIRDKTVLVCSERSLKREAVVKEIIKALEMQLQTGKQKLFPVRLDDYLFSEELLAVEETMVETGNWKRKWVEFVRKIMVADFREWDSQRKYQPELERVLKALRAK